MSDISHSLQVSTIFLQDFRCFSQTTIDLDGKIVLICGANGTGKTSLLEALYYACYLRSFRTHSTKDLIALNKNSFFLKLVVTDHSLPTAVDHAINIGFSGNKRLVKIDNKSTVSYKDLLVYYRVVSLTEDDLMLVKGSPEDRRLFLDQALLLYNPHFLTTLKDFRCIVEQRNALLQMDKIDNEIYFIWSKKLWEATIKIQQMRKDMLRQLERDSNAMIAAYFDDATALTFTYNAKKKSDLTFDEFWTHNESTLLREELVFRRSLFGAHLDDFTITLEGKKSRAFASRGQQKMILLLIKAAQVQRLITQKGSVIFLLDDFMTDFDPMKGAALLKVLFHLNCQLIFTSPHHISPLEGALHSLGYIFKKISI